MGWSAWNLMFGLEQKAHHTKRESAKLDKMHSSPM